MINNPDPADTYKNTLPKNCRTFTNVGHVLGHETILNKFRTEIIKSMSSDHEVIKWKTSDREISGKSLTIWK